MPSKRAPKSKPAKKAGLDTFGKIGISEAASSKPDGNAKGVGPGRPSGYSIDIAAEILERIATTKDSLKKICSTEGMPAVSTVFLWFGSHPEFSEGYARAKQQQAELLVEEMLEISDDGSNDTYTTEDGREIVNTDVVQRSKLRIDTRKWLASKLLPKKYGEKVELAHSGEINSKVTVLTEERRQQLAAKKREAVLRRMSKTPTGAN